MEIRFAEIKNKLTFISHDDNNQPHMDNIAEKLQRLEDNPDFTDRITIINLNKLIEMKMWEPSEKENALNILPIVLNQQEDGSLQVVDGKTRLLSLYKAKADNFKLNVKILDHWKIKDTINLYVDLNAQYKQLTKKRVYDSLCWFLPEK